MARTASFFRDNHRYVFLGTSALALVGVFLSMQPRPDMSFLRGAYGLEVVLYWILVVWLVLSGVALMLKLLHWEDYAEVSPFLKKPLVDCVRWFSYLVWMVALVFIIDRVIMGFASAIHAGITADANPEDDLASAAYMVYNSLDIYRQGIINTILLAVIGTIFAFIIALLLVFARMQTIDRQDNDFVRFWKVVGRAFAIVYSTVIRGTPMMVQALIIYFFGFGLLKNSGMTVGEIGKVWSTFTAGAVIMTLSSSPYMLEVLRAGIEAVDKGQYEAARSLGLSQWQAMMKVVFPQGIRNAIPALSNEFIINIKDTSILSVVGVLDLMFVTTTVTGMYFKTTPVYIVAALIYLVLTMCANALLSAISKRMGATAGEGFEVSDLGRSHGDH